MVATIILKIPSWEYQTFKITIICIFVTDTQMMSSPFKSKPHFPCKNLLTFPIPPLGNRLQARLFSSLSHIDSEGNFSMVDVGAKTPSRRQAQASATVILGASLAQMLTRGEVLKKGAEALTVARLAGTMAAKKTSDLIPLCHQLQMNFVGVEVELFEDRAVFVSTIRVDGKTGCELEALTAVSVAALTLYDMCKAVNKSIKITDIKLLSKSGGKSGDFKCSD